MALFIMLYFFPRLTLQKKTIQIVVSFSTSSIRRTKNCWLSNKKILQTKTGYFKNTLPTTKWLWRYGLSRRWEPLTWWTHRSATYMAWNTTKFPKRCTSPDKIIADCFSFSANNIFLPQKTLYCFWYFTAVWKQYLAQEKNFCSIKDARITKISLSERFFWYQKSF